VVAKYGNKNAPVVPPRPSQRTAKKLPPTPVRHESEYDVICPIKKNSEYDTVSISSTKSEFKSYDLQTLCEEVSLPKAVQVTDGFCGATEDIPIGYRMMIYFQKMTRAVKAKDLLDSVYNVPLNSSLKFAPIDDLQQTSKMRDGSGFYYDTIEEMLQERPSIPSIVQAKGSFVRGKHTIFANDILFPQKVDKSTLGSKVIGMKCIKQSGEEIKLPLDCNCGFSTATKDTQLYLPEYIKYVNQFPVKVKVFGIDNEIHIGMPTTLVLLGESMLKTVVTRSLHCETEVITEISLDIPIKIRCIDLDNEVSEHKRVKKVYETFSTSKVSNFYFVANTNAQHHAQRQLYANVRREIESTYYDIVVPENITQTGIVTDSPKPSRHRILKAAEGLLKPHRSHSFGGGDSIKNGEVTNPALKDKLLKTYSPLPVRQKPDNDASDEADNDIQTNLKQQFKSLAESLRVEIKKEIKQEVMESSLHEEIRKLRVDNARCLQQLARMNEEVEELKKQNESTSSPKAKQAMSKSTDRLPRPVRGSDPLEEISPEENKKVLRSLNHLEVLQLLDGMKLAQYKPEFKNSFVDGQLLATLAQTELVELKVNNSLHQRKLLNVIQGKESAQKYLLFSQEDPHIN